MNTSGDATADPATLAENGVAWVRCVMYEEQDTQKIRDWISALMNGTPSIEVLLVGDGSSTSLGEDESQWAARMQMFKDRYGDLVSFWQWGNEPDGGPPASWIMNQARVNRLMQVARTVFPAGGPDTLLSPGLVSGRTDWLDGRNLQTGEMSEEVVNLDLVDVLDVHPYNKFPGTPELRGMIDGYLVKKTPLWCTEFDGRTLGMGAALLQQVTRAAAMCWVSEQTVGTEGIDLGVFNHPERLSDFRVAVGLAPLETVA
jgi:hypothetical protein